jgi:uncharacterized Tic20 family protein
MSENQNHVPPTINPPPVTPPPASPPPAAGSESQARMWNMFCHLSALAGFIGVPFGNIIGPLIIWQLKKNEFPSVDVHGKAALNFQITATIAAIAVVLACIVLSFVCFGWLLIPAVVLVGLAALVFTIIAGLKANNGEEYKYPYSFPFVK